MTSGIRIIPQDAAPPPDAAPDPTAEREAMFKTVLLAVMAGRRVMVVSDGHPDGGRTLGGRVAGHMNSSCGLGLLATAHRGATVEDLLVQVSSDLGAGGSGDMEQLALALERGLEAAGSGLLVVLDAHLLDAATVGDLFELSRSDTDSGLYMQVLLIGSPALDRLLERPGLAGIARQVASARWTMGEAPPVAALAPEVRPQPVPAEPPSVPAAAVAAPALRPPPHRAELRRRRPPADETADRPAPRTVRTRMPEPAPSKPGGRRKLRWTLAGLLVLLAFGAGFATNAMWPPGARSTANLLSGDGRSALTAGLPNPSPARPMPPAPLPEPEPLPAALPSEPMAPPPTAAALPPDWERPAGQRTSQPESPRAAVPQQQGPPRAAAPVAAQAPQGDRPVVAPPVRLTPPPQAPEPAPRRQVAQEPASARDVCAEGAGGRAAPDASLSGFAQGFMSDLRSLGRCLGSLAQP